MIDMSIFDMAIILKGKKISEDILNVHFIFKKCVNLADHYFVLMFEDANF